MDTDTMTYGPHTAQVVELLIRLANMTADEARGISGMPAGSYVRMATEARISAYKHVEMDRRGELIEALTGAIPAARDAVQEAADRVLADERSWEAMQEHGDSWDIADAAATNAVVGLVLQDILHPADYETLTVPIFNALGVTP